ncbi:MAG: hypothetical protein J6T08_01570 [Lentisphaeria bacterium]|nr:hypothetical protein [Lentisphaeria bacterium]
MKEVIAALTGVVVGAIIESITYGIKRHTERSADLADNLTEALERIVMLYTVKYKFDPREPEIIEANLAVKHRLSAFVRHRNKLWNSAANKELIREFNELQCVRGQTITEDFLNNGKTFVEREDLADACRKKAEVAERMIRHVSKIHSVF